MVKEYFKNLKSGEKARESLSTLRSLIKEEEQKEILRQLVGDGAALSRYLTAEDAKTRKNAALLIGDLQLQQQLMPLKEAYEKETILFVKSAYLAAMSKLDASDLLAFFKEQRERLLAVQPEEEEKKHICEELHELFLIISGIEGVKPHTFCGLKRPREILLSTNREQREVTLGEVAELSAAVQRKAELHPLGVSVYTKEVQPFTTLRTYRELLFVCGKNISEKPKEAAKQLLDSGLPEFLEECHKEAAPFLFRVEVKALTPQTEYAKKLSAALEQLSHMKLVNDTKDFEVEIRFILAREGGYAAFLRLKTIPMRRFSYRKNAVAMSIHPAAAAMMMRLAKPYLKENAQILDPCCGVGTMLIERDICVPAREIYGIDTFGEAITGARENASRAGERIHFIHRDFFDFKHSYPFDEIVTNMPVRGRKSKEEMDCFYEEFFRKAASLLVPQGRLILYSNEAGFVKKQLRLHGEYRLLQEFCIRKKEQFYLYIMELR